MTASIGSSNSSSNSSYVSTLPNGLRVLTTALPSSQAASLSFFVRVGARNEQPRTNGLSHYIEHLLFKGTQRRPTAALISEAIEGAGGQLNAYTSQEVTCYWNALPFEAMETGLDVLADMLQHSLLDPVEIDRERTVVQHELRRSHDSPGAWAGELIGRAVFGDQPIGWPVGGSLETVAAMQRPDFIAHIQAHYTAQNAVLSVAGHVQHAQVVELAERHFGDLARGTPPEGAPARHGLPAEHVIVEERPIEQTNLVLSMQAIGRRDPDRYALDVMNTVLGRGMSSRLFTEVRERRGLAYSVGSGTDRMRDIGTLTVSAGVTREHEEEALQVIVYELRRLVDEPVPGDELQRCIDYVAGSLRLSQETARTNGQRYGNQLIMDGELETVDETVARIRAVTAEDVQQVARRIIGPGAFALAVVGPSASADRLDALITA
ncbi:MAG: insulinase family protein [Dehalococcoidia bacterium]|nr:insulinase family protein [Dehalococcoidia bacterium]